MIFYATILIFCHHLLIITSPLLASKENVQLNHQRKIHHHLTQDAQGFQAATIGAHDPLASSQIIDHLDGGPIKGAPHQDGGQLYQSSYPSIENHRTIHKLMSKEDLRRTFQVDDHDQVPEYEVLNLALHDQGSHYHHYKQHHDIPSSSSPLNHQHPLSSHQIRSSNKQTASDSMNDNQDNQQQQDGKLVNDRNKRDADHLDEKEGENKEDEEILMKLSTFGKDFKLRLKRNADFQKRIKDMKMFMAESTKDGQLRYTEINVNNNHHQPQQQQQQPSHHSNQYHNHKQEPHKRDTGAYQQQDLTANGKQDDDDHGGQRASSQEPAQGHHNAASQPTMTTSGSSPPDIGLTYHDEDNLAALLIDHDKSSGHLQVDGTIGNDFVIKPMPRATVELLNRRHQQQQLAKSQQQQQSRRQGQPADVSPAVQVPLPQTQQQPQPTSQAQAQAQPQSQPTDLLLATERAISHMHDDDPHDDDEMFLDEDEALELAHLRPPANTSLDQLPLQPAVARKQAPRTLSKAASERKLKKYRKLMAQTQVPKASQLAAASSGGRVRRHVAPGNSHHIIYRLKPSAEGSSSEHRHSFMASPSELRSMDLLALRQLRRGSSAGAAEDTPMRLPLQLTDGLEDPLGGQFYLEPGTFTGVHRAGLSDWSLVQARPSNWSSTDGPTLGNATSRGPRRKRQASQQRRTKRQAPDTVWPEVLLVVDYDSFLLHGGDSRDVKRYFVSFWNGVDLRYKLLVHPHIRISLAGMIVAKDRDATPYLERNRLRAPNADAVDAAGALTDMGKYLYREDRLPTYDLAVVITKLDMCRRRYEGGRCNRGTAGFAYVGGACVVNKRLEKVNSVAIIEDSGGFSGIIVAAHEVGHLLGCVHDGSPPPSYLGGPGATQCPWEDGFIMSDLRHTERGFRWSQCSVEQFKHFLNGETATCLYNYPHESQALHRLLPGTMLSLDEQCKRDRGTNACFKDARVCAQLFCFDSASGYCVSYRPAAEGSPCGENQVCRNGKCVGEIENIIPDYTHQSQTIVPRGRAHPVARLADNGLSASSTSAATSSPDSKLPAVTQTQQLSSRMDTIPMDTPTRAAGADLASLYPALSYDVPRFPKLGDQLHQRRSGQQAPPSRQLQFGAYGPASVGQLYGLSGSTGGPMHTSASSPAATATSALQAAVYNCNC